jgi:hypothetical protein
VCFFHDYDWYAELCEETEGPAPAPARCGECRRPIAAGQWRHRVYQQQYEECRACGNGDCECPGADGTGECCRCPVPSFGETAEYDRCESCDKVLRAVEAVELADGCHHDNARPALCGLSEEALNRCNNDHADEYAAKAVELFPEVAGHLAALGWRPDDDDDTGGEG